MVICVITKFHLMDEVENSIFIMNKQLYRKLMNEINDAVYLHAQIDPYFHHNMHGIKVIRDLYIGLMLNEEDVLLNDDLAFIYTIRKTLIQSILFHPVVVDLKLDVQKTPQLAFYTAIHIANYYAKHYIFFEDLYKKMLGNELLEYVKNGDMREMFNPAFRQFGEYPKEIIQIQAMATKFIVQINNENKAEITSYFKQVKQKISAHKRQQEKYIYLKE